MKYELEAIVVTDSKLFDRTGDVGRWAAKVELAFTGHAIEKSPSSLESGRPIKSKANLAYPSGSMRLNIRGEVNRIGVRHYQTTVLVDVPYALYVIRGTKSPIFARSARIPAGVPEGGQFTTGKMYLPSWKGGKSMFRQRVSGQRANNFLGDAFDATARTHSSLRGFSMVG